MRNVHCDTSPCPCKGLKVTLHAVLGSVGIGSMTVDGLLAGLQAKGNSSGVACVVTAMVT